MDTHNAKQFMDVEFVGYSYISWTSMGSIENPKEIGKPS